MTRSRWLIAIAVAGVVIFGLSFVNAWIVHDRELRGEGYRYVQYFLSAWRGVGVPVLSAAAVAALATAAWAVAVLRRPSLPAWPLMAGSVLVLGLMVAVAWPLSQDGHASSVDLSPGLLLPAGMLLGAVMFGGSMAVAGPSRRDRLVLALAAVAVIVAGAGTRHLGLQLAEGTGRHWSEGSYTRPAMGDRAEANLTIGDGRFEVHDRWSGTWEWSGWTVIVDDDPACPGSRGTYHAHGEEDEAIRFVKVVDPCAEGERAADFETGIWERVP
jgi:hypothetical protein